MSSNHRDDKLFNKPVERVKCDICGCLVIHAMFTTESSSICSLKCASEYNDICNKLADRSLLDLMDDLSKACEKHDDLSSFSGSYFDRGE